MSNIDKNEIKILATADDGIVLLELFAEGGLECGQAWRAGLGQGLAGAQPLIEVRRAQVELVSERLSVPVDDQWHHAQAVPGLEHRLQVGRAVGDDPDGSHSRDATYG